MHSPILPKDFLPANPTVGVWVSYAVLVVCAGKIVNYCFETLLFRYNACLTEAQIDEIDDIPMLFQGKVGQGDAKPTNYVSVFQGYYDTLKSLYEEKKGGEDIGVGMGGFMRKLMKTEEELLENYANLAPNELLESEHAPTNDIDFVLNKEKDRIKGLATTFDKKCEQYLACEDPLALSVDAWVKLDRVRSYKQWLTVISGLLQSFKIAASEVGEGKEPEGRVIDENNGLFSIKYFLQKMEENSKGRALLQKKLRSELQERYRGRSRTRCWCFRKIAASTEGKIMQAVDILFYCAVIGGGCLVMQRLDHFSGEIQELTKLVVSYGNRCWNRTG